MPGHRRTLSIAMLRTDLLARSFAPARGDRVGVEAELTPIAARDGRFDARTAREGVDALFTDLAGGADSSKIAWRGGFLTREPGGQVEFSGPPFPSADDAASAVRWATRRLRVLARRRGVDLAAIGFHPWASAAAIGLGTSAPRYRAMQEYFDRIGPAGRRMMRLTGSVQVCVDFGPGAEGAARWELAQRLAPVLAAAFANSAVELGRPACEGSLRAATWLAIDPGRTGIPPGFLGDPESHPVDQYLEFALSAPVMFIRRADGTHEVPDPSMTFRNWMDEGHAAGTPDFIDWHVHLSTLFPDVRPQGYLEVRSIDAPGNAWLDVPVLVVGHALRDHAARRELLDLLRPHHDRISIMRESAATSGLRDPLLGRLAIALFAAVRPHLGPAAESRVAAYEERFIASGRSPGDELAGQVAEGGDLDPAMWFGQGRSRIGRG